MRLDDLWMEDKSNCYKRQNYNTNYFYNYLCLKQENKVKEFLQYYPEHNVIFNKFKQFIF